MNLEFQWLNILFQSMRKCSKNGMVSAPSKEANILMVGFLIVLVTEGEETASKWQSINSLEKIIKLDWVTWLAYFSAKMWFQHQEMKNPPNGSHRTVLYSFPQSHDQFPSFKKYQKSKSSQWFSSYIEVCSAWQLK